ncbi:hypothetical protein BH20ACT2_BH20ACT2_10140 [soil metagenome]
MIVHLIRHGAAGSRTEWAQPDDLRPLDDRGRRQAERLADELCGRSITTILSSPALRCSQTVGPLARRLGLAVETVPWLLEGTEAGAAIARLADEAEQATGEVAACSHGDVIPEVLRHLSAHGLALPEPRRSQKGSVWSLDWDGERFTTGRYSAAG